MRRKLDCNLEKTWSIRVDWWVEKEWRQHSGKENGGGVGGEGEVVVCFLTLH